MEGIGVIDISPFVQSAIPEEHCKNNVVENVLQALSSHGFMYVVGHGIPEEQLEASITNACEFFYQSDEEKKKLLSHDRAKRGYAPLETENFASLIGEKRPNDLCEKVRFGPSIPAESERCQYYSSKQARCHFTRNEWGDQSRSFQETVSSYYEAMEQLTSTLLHIIARGLMLSPDVFTSKMDRHTSILSMNYYPPICAQADNSPSTQLRVAEHTDVSMITIVYQRTLSCSSCCMGWTGGGLEVWAGEEGQWTSVPHIAGRNTPTPPRPPILDEYTPFIHNCAMLYCV